MEWMMEPTAWAGLATLVVLEIVLGIDNLIFIAILSDKLAPHQRKKARIIGLTLALFMRMLLLTVISWLTKLTSTLFTILGSEISGRDLIMLVGGAFLLFKGTKELHEKLEGSHAKKSGPMNYASFWQVIIQIVILDAVFSFDAVITAVGMTEHLSIMMLAVIIAIGLMILSANPLMNFVTAHPTIVILCLGFLLMIGFSLIVDGLGYHIPKGYLYAAIGFSVAIEALNQWELRNRRKNVRKIDPRVRLSQAVLSLLGTKTSEDSIASEISVLSDGSDDFSVFDPRERMMMSRILQLRDTTVDSAMTPRHDLYWVDLDDDKPALLQEIAASTYSCIIVGGENGLSNPKGVIYKKEIADLLLQKKDSIDHLKTIIRQPVIIPENANILAAMELFRQSRIHEAFVVDEYGALEGILTLTDIAEAILGDMPEEHAQDGFRYSLDSDGSWICNGNMTLYDLRDLLGIENLPEGDYTTGVGIVLSALKRLPQEGDEIEIPQWRIRVESMENRRVNRLRFIPIE